MPFFVLKFKNVACIQKTSELRTGDEHINRKVIMNDDVKKVTFSSGSI